MHITSTVVTCNHILVTSVFYLVHHGYKIQSIIVADVIVTLSLCTCTKIKTTSYYIRPFLLITHEWKSYKCSQLQSVIDACT